MKLTVTAERFVLHWGEMGSRWGINRTVAQIHALLFLSPNPLPADEIASTLNVARSNVSNSVRELQGWRLVKVVHVLGDRRDHFETLTDVWEMFRIIAEERKRREVDPTLDFLRDSLAAAKKSKEDAVVRRRLADMLEFFEDASEIHDRLQAAPPTAALKAVRVQGKLRAWLGTLGKKSR